MTRLLFAFGLGWIASVMLLSNFIKAESPSAGRKDLFERRCSGCHALDKDKEGPRLRLVYGAKAGTSQSFLYSDALKSAGITWDAASLDKWLTDPEELVPSNDMAFRLSKPEERSEIIAYLKQLSGK